MKKTRKILIFGPQGSGKGTQAELLARNFGFVYISTGDIFRRHIKNKTKLGQEALKYINYGKLVPDETVNKIAISEIKKLKAKKSGFILDGFPRNLIQASALNAETEITDAIVINLTDSEAMKRISGRRVCKCGRSYHLKHNPPKNFGICDKCGNKIFVRDDDKPVAIKKRLKIYHEETEPVFRLYKKLGAIKIIDGRPAISEVFKSIKKILKLK